MNLDTKLLLFTAFNAGGILVGIRYAFREVKHAQSETTTQLNGMGRKFERLKCMLILWADTDEKRQQLAEAIKPLDK